MCKVCILFFKFRFEVSFVVIGIENGEIMKCRFLIIYKNLGYKIKRVEYIGWGWINGGVGNEEIIFWWRSL